MSGYGANIELDIKKVIALSTLSQLGIIFIILGLGEVELAFFHLIIHALFKSSLFISIGLCIHNINNNQDGRYIISFTNTNIFLILCLISINSSLIAFPFLAGYY